MYILLFICQNSQKYLKLSCLQNQTIYLNPPPKLLSTRMILIIINSQGSVSLDIMEYEKWVIITHYDLARLAFYF